MNPSRVILAPRPVVRTSTKIAVASPAPFVGRAVGGAQTGTIRARLSPTFTSFSSPHPPVVVIDGIAAPSEFHASPGLHEVGLMDAFGNVIGSGHVPVAAGEVVDIVVGPQGAPTVTGRSQSGNAALAAVEFRPAGAAQRTSYPAGAFDFRMAAQAFRTEPRVNRDALSARFNEALAAIMPAGVTGTITNLWVSQGHEVDPAGVSVENQAGSSWWVTITGTVNATAPWNLTGTAGLNRALARAVTNAMTLGPTEEPRGQLAGTILRSFPGYAPHDGTQLMGVLDNPEACGSFQNTRQMWMRACTTITPAGSAVQPGPSPTGASATLTPISAPSTTAPTTCKVTIASAAWIRPTATFDHVGPQVPAGTVLALLGRTNLTQGSLRLYHVRVVGGASGISNIEGFAALASTDMRVQQPTGCASGVVAENVSTGSAPRPVLAPPSHTTSTPTPAQPSGGTGAGGSSDAFPWGTAALAAGGVLAVGAAVMNRDKIMRAIEGAKPGARAAYARGKASARSAYDRARARLGR